MRSVLLVVGAVLWAQSASAASPVPLCVTAANAASGLQDSGTKHAAKLREALSKDKDAKALVTVVEDCTQAVVVVTVADQIETRTNEKDVWDPNNKRTGTRTQISNYEILKATLAVPVKTYTTELAGERLVGNMFSTSSVETLLIKKGPAVGQGERRATYP